MSASARPSYERKAGVALRSMERSEAPARTRQPELSFFLLLIGHGADHNRASHAIIRVWRRRRLWRADVGGYHGDRVPIVLRRSVLSGACPCWTCQVVAGLVLKSIHGDAAHEGPSPAGWVASEIDWFVESDALGRGHDAVTATCFGYRDGAGCCCGCWFCHF